MGGWERTKPCGTRAFFFSFFFHARIDVLRELGKTDPWVPSPDISASSPRKQSERRPLLQDVARRIEPPRMPEITLVAVL